MKLCIVVLVSAALLSGCAAVGGIASATLNSVNAGLRAPAQTRRADNSVSCVSNKIGDTVYTTCQ